MMRRSLNISFILASLILGGAAYAAAKPHAGPAPGSNRTWTNDDLRHLSKVQGLISVVGQPSNEASQGANAPAPQAMKEDLVWYAGQAASLNAQLEAEEADLQKFAQALQDARELKPAAGGINLAEEDMGITPEATIDILQGRVRETQNELDGLEELARQNNIPPGVLRGQ